MSRNVLTEAITVRQTQYALTYQAHLNVHVDLDTSEMEKNAVVG